MATNNPTSTPGRGEGGITPCLSPRAIAQQMQFFIPRSKKTKKSAKTYEQIAEQYLKTCLIQIKRGITTAKKESIEQGYFYIDMDWLRDQNPNQYTYGGKRCWWFDWLQTAHPMFKIVARGYSKNGIGRLTKVELLKENDYQRVVDETAEETFTRCYQGLGDQIDRAEYVPIDRESLTNYISNLQDIKDLTTRLRYEYLARQILSIAEFVNANSDEGYAIPHIPKPSPYGRVYYQGFNLQNCPSAVREAALGKHTKYDIVSSVFAWQLLMVDNRFLTPATKELVLERQRIRHQLAQDCIQVDVSKEFKIKIIKEAITAMGFGANLKGNAYYDSATDTWVRNALASIIKNPDDRLRFQEHPWVQEFAEEQKKITDYIVSLVDTALLPKDIDLFNKKNQLRPSKLMSYIYQHYEYDLVSQLKQIIPVDYDWLLMVHDGFYLRHRLTGTRMRELALEINPYVRIEGDTNESWTSAETREYHEEIKAKLEHRWDPNDLSNYIDWSNKKGTDFYSRNKT